MTGSAEKLTAGRGDGGISVFSLSLADDLADPSPGQAPCLVRGCGSGPVRLRQRLTAAIRLPGARLKQAVDVLRIGAVDSLLL